MRLAKEEQLEKALYMWFAQRRGKGMQSVDHSYFYSSLEDN